MWPSGPRMFDEDDDDGDDACVCVCVCVMMWGQVVERRGAEQRNDCATVRKENRFVVCV
jgi:hypothetical protein